MTVHAPFRFSPINRWVYSPDWADLVTHDVPFADGLSGEIQLEIRAETPLLVGGGRRKATEDREGEVWPFRIGKDGPYAIPGSSLQGMVRSILEIAAFGRLGDWVDDRRFGIRDLSNPAKPYYRDIIAGKVKAGFLTITPTPEDRNHECWKITPCGEPRRIRFSNLPVAADWSKRESASDRYARVDYVGPFVAVGGMEVTALNPDPQGNAWLVMTGNTGAKDRAKYRAFVFVGNSSATDIILTPEEIAEFKFINQDGGNADTKHWNDTWRHFQTSGYGDDLPVRQGGRIPIFYIDDTTGRGGIQMGLASMFKLAHAQSPKDLLRNSDPDHLNKDKADLASLIFGSEANDRGDRGLKRRVAFDMALPPETDRKHRFDQPNTEIKSAVLLSPKPSYFPIYVRQAPGGQSGQARAAVYATYTPLNPKKDDKNVTPLHEAPELAGVKIWPAGLYPGRRAHAPYLEHDELTKIATTLHPLPAGSLFMTTARFHNLRPVELGAVLWALSFGMRPSEGDVQPPRHRLGMGKPLGLGEVSIRMVKLSARTLGGHTDAEAGRYVEAFEKEMRTQYAAVSAGADWSESAQVAALRKAAMPPAETARVQDRRWNGRPWIVNQSDYMELNPKAKDHFGKVGWNDFQEAKNKGEFLPPYVPGAHELVKHEHSGSAIQSGYDVAAKVDSKSGPRKGAAVRVKTTGAEGIISGDQRPDGKWPLDLGPNGKTALSIGQFELIGQSSTF